MKDDRIRICLNCEIEILRLQQKHEEANNLDELCKTELSKGGID